jgi:hypothetical protein
MSTEVSFTNIDNQVKKTYPSVIVFLVEYLCFCVPN